MSGVFWGAVLFVLELHSCLLEGMGMYGKSTMCCYPNACVQRRYEWFVINELTLALTLSDPFVKGNVGSFVISRNPHRRGKSHEGHVSNTVGA